MPKAAADLPVPRTALLDPTQRRRMRYTLYKMLTRLGRIDHATLRYFRDPTDGPLAERGLPDDDTAVVRATAHVTPRES